MTPATARARLRGILFDKDGTLFDFRATWDVWADDTLRALARGRADRLEALAAEARFDLAARRFLPDSPIIAGTNREAAQCLARALPDWEVGALETELARRAADAPLAPAVPLTPFLARLRAMGLGLGVMTNDTESTAHAHLRAAGVADDFDFVAGFDSGFGAKPAPEPLLAFARAIGVAAEDVAMVGDSRHDLMAGRAAGMLCVGVLTGTAEAHDLHDLAHVVLPDIGHLPDWIGTRAA